MTRAKHAKIGMSLPREQLESIERERAATGETRSGFIQRAVEALLREAQRARWDREYVEGYRRMPETVEERRAARAVVARSIAATDWDDDWDAEYRETHERQRAAQ